MVATHFFQNFRCFKLIGALATLISTLQTEMLGIKTRLTEREVQVDSLQEIIVNLAHENELLKRRIYGIKTERLRTSENQLALGNLLDDENPLQKQLNEAIAQAKKDGEASSEPVPPPAPKAKPKGCRDLLSSDLPRFLVDIRDPKLEQTAKLIGWDESPQLMYRRGGFAVLVKRTAKYEVPDKDGPTVLGVELPETLFPRGLLHSSVVAHILVQKFALGVPHYRLEQHLLDQGVDLDRGMMSRYVDDAGGSLGATVVHAMWQDAIQNAAIISTDATGALIQPEKRQDARPARRVTPSRPSPTVITCYSRTPRTTRKTLCVSYSERSRASCKQTRATFSTSSSVVRQKTKTLKTRSGWSGVGRTVGAISSRPPSASTRSACRGCCAFAPSMPQMIR